MESKSRRKSKTFWEEKKKDNSNNCQPKGWALCQLFRFVSDDDELVARVEKVYWTKPSSRLQLWQRRVKSLALF